MIVAAIGILMNGGTALLFMRGRERDLDVARFSIWWPTPPSRSGSLFGLPDPEDRLDELDPLVEPHHFGYHRARRLEAGAGTPFDLALPAIPPGIDAAEVRGSLERLDGVERIHDLHIWAMSTADGSSPVAW